MESAKCERGFSIRTLTKTGQRYLLGHSLVAAFMMIEMNGPNGRSDGANSGIYQYVEELQEEVAVKEQCRCNPAEQERTGHEECLLSTLGP